MTITATEMIEQKEKTLEELKGQIDEAMTNLKESHQEAGKARLRLLESETRKKVQKKIEIFQRLLDNQEKPVLELEAKEEEHRAKLRELVETYNLLAGKNYRSDAYVSWREKVVYRNEQGLIKFLEDAKRDDLLRVKKELDKRKFNTDVAKEILEEIPQTDLFYIDNVSSFTVKDLVE